MKRTALVTALLAGAGALAAGPAMSGPTGPVASAAAAAAASTWEQATTLGSAGRYGRTADIAVSPDGRAVAVWTRAQAQHTRHVLLAAVRRAGGAWSDPLVIAPEAAGHRFPSVALDARGAATVVWQRYDDKGGVSVAARRITAGGTLTRAVRLGRVDDGGGLPSLAVDPAGTATVAWSKQHRTRSWIQVVRRPAGGSWTDPKRLSPRDGDTGLPTVAASGAGTVVAWPGAASYAKPSRVWVAVRDGAGWADPEPVSPRGSIFAADAVVTETGTVVATWSRYPAGDAPARAEVAERPGGGLWSSAELLPSGDGGLDPAVATGHGGDVVVAWRSVAEDGRSRTAASFRPAGGEWEPPTFLSPAGSSVWFPRVVLDGAGAATVAWEQRGGGRSVVAARRDPVAGWLPSETLSGDGERATEPALAVTGDGAVTAVWTRLDGTNRVRTTTGPRLG